MSQNSSAPFAPAYLNKIQPAPQLSAILSRIRNSTPGIVFTNGCFDILHKGHVSYLAEARKLGDLLVVALNSDSSIKKIKGPTRPINTLEDRLEVIAALEAASFVTWFDEETPLELIRLLRPKILVKGGDWQPEQIEGAKDVRSWGGQVFSLPYREGRSTTGIISKARLS